MYMNGRGVIDKTEQLNDRVFYALPTTWLGCCFCFICVGLSQSPISQLNDAALLSAAVVSAFFIPPWFEAVGNLRRHRKAMERELASRGKGWATS